MDKILFVRGARIAFSIWDVGGDDQSLNHIPEVCKGAGAILIMFDLTNRSTLNNTIGWFQRARNWNKVQNVPISAVSSLLIMALTDVFLLPTILTFSFLCIIQTAVPVLVGTKFDEFVQLPLEMQWTIVNQARAYARAMKATLFFSSASHNINVNKIFKFIAAKLFNLPWSLERNLTVGEPIIDF
ncbi:hypothetical protein ZIOFF_013235 [Zingiber officinale]|uniref:Septum-promoting GTP-binding protein 1 n=1 Tax=Zingiber officinale TaxID=94328 RepID=A0A8J5LCI1_ZINOF|nr:hypothetical protein ZIOFF_013235 [Zingiber officinale]